MSLVGDVWKGCRKINLRSLAKFVGSSAGTALVGAMAGHKAAAAAAVVAGLVVAQAEPVVAKPAASAEPECAPGPVTEPEPAA